MQSFTSLTSLALSPAVRAYLKALDTGLNSNTLLLVTAHEEPMITPSQATAGFTMWINDPLFPEMFHEAKYLHGWAGNHAKVQKFHVVPDLITLTPTRYMQRLWWLLQDAPSPYNCHVSPEKARQRLAGFLSDTFGVTIPVEHTTYPATYDFASFDPPQTFFFDVDLPSVARRLGNWFDNLGADSITVWCQDDIMSCLITNGSD